MSDAGRLIGWARQGETLLGFAAFFAALLSRTVWLPYAPLTPDPATTLWMALDGVRNGILPDHGLVSSYHAFQPPGLVWLSMPFVALGGGRPELTMIVFGAINAGSIALLVVTIARRWGNRIAVPAAAFFAVGPDVYMSPMVWHPSLFTAAACLVLTSGIRLRLGSIWWALPLAATPGMYGLIHYSGLALYGPSLALMVTARRRAPKLLLPLFLAAGVTALGWLPFFAFESSRDWVDISTILNSADQQPGLVGKVMDRSRGAIKAVLHLGQGWHGAVFLTPVLVGLPVLALVVCWRRRRIDEPVAVAALLIASGIATQVVANMGARYDVLLLWLPGLYLLASWFIAQLPNRTVPLVLSVVVGLGVSSLVRAVNSTPESQTLSAVWATVDASPSQTYQDLYSLNSIYLPCDPPYTWGVESWYLREARNSGAGTRAAVRAGAFRDRSAPCPWRTPGTGRQAKRDGGHPAARARWIPATIVGLQSRAGLQRRGNCSGVVAR